MRHQEAEITQRIDMTVAATESENYEPLRATIRRMQREIEGLWTVIKLHKLNVLRMEAIIRDQRAEIAQYQAMLESAMGELAKMAEAA